MGIFGNRWWVVAASVLGLIVGSGAINVFAFGVFLKPVTADLGIGRGAFGAGLVLNSALTAIGCIPLGWALDRYGARRVMIPGILLFALAAASYSMLTPSPMVIVLLFGVAGIVGCFQTPVPYATVLSKWFDRDRGLALGIAMAGVGLGVALVPQISTRLIDAFGWRMAYVGLGVTILVLAWLPVTIFVREPSEAEMSRRAERPQSEALPGMTAREAIGGSWRFWTLTVAFLLAVAAINGTLTQVVALLTDRGVPRDVAVQALSAAGLAIIIGRILCGWCLDRFRGSVVAICFFIVPMCGIALLASGAAGFVPILGAVLCGMGIGAEVDLMAFFTSRYFGLKAYGKIYGLMFAFFSVSTGIGPFLSGRTYDMYHSYTPIFMVFEVMLVVTCLLFLPLGPYRYPPLAGGASGSPRKAVA
jgi:MFS family permease